MVHPIHNPSNLTREWRGLIWASTNDRNAFSSDIAALTGFIDICDLKDRISQEQALDVVKSYPPKTKSNGITIYPTRIFTHPHIQCSPSSFSLTTLKRSPCLFDRITILPAAGTFQLDKCYKHRNTNEPCSITGTKIFLNHPFSHSEWSECRASDLFFSIPHTGYCILFPNGKGVKVTPSGNVESSSSNSSVIVQQEEKKRGKGVWYNHSSILDLDTSLGPPEPSSTSRTLEPPLNQVTSPAHLLSAPLTPPYTPQPATRSSAPITLRFKRPAFGLLRASSADPSSTSSSGSHPSSPLFPPKEQEKDSPIEEARSPAPSQTSEYSLICVAPGSPDKPREPPLPHPITPTVQEPSVPITEMGLTPAVHCYAPTDSYTPNRSDRHDLAQPTSLPVHQSQRLGIGQSSELALQPKSIDSFRPNNGCAKNDEGNGKQDPERSHEQPRSRLTEQSGKDCFSTRSTSSSMRQESLKRSRKLVEELNAEHIRAIERMRQSNTTHKSHRDLDSPQSRADSHAQSSASCDKCKSHDDAVQSLDDMRKERDKEKETSAALRAELEQIIRSRDELKMALSKERIASEQDAANLKAEIDFCKQDASYYMAKTKDYHYSVSVKQAEITSLHARLEEREKITRELEEKLSTGQGDTGQAEEITRLKGVISGLRKNSAQQHTTIAQHESSIAKLKADHDIAKDEIDELKKRNDKLEKENEDLGRSVQAAKDKASTIESNLTACRGELKKAYVDRSFYEARSAQLETQGRKSANEIQTLEKQLTLARGDASTAERNVKSLKESLNAAFKRAETAERELEMTKVAGDLFNKRTEEYLKAKQQWILEGKAILESLYSPTPDFHDQCPDAAPCDLPSPPLTAAVTNNTSPDIESISPEAANDTSPEQSYVDWDVDWNVGDGEVDQDADLASLHSGRSSPEPDSSKAEATSSRRSEQDDDAGNDQVQALEETRRDLQREISAHAKTTTQLEKQLDELNKLKSTFTELEKENKRLKATAGTMTKQLERAGKDVEQSHQCFKAVKDDLEVERERSKGTKTIGKRKRMEDVEDKEEFTRQMVRYLHQLKRELPEKSESDDETDEDDSVDFMGLAGFGSPGVAEGHERGRERRSEISRLKEKISELEGVIIRLETVIINSQGQSHIKDPIAERLQGQGQGQAQGQNGDEAAMIIRDTWVIKYVELLDWVTKLGLRIPSSFDVKRVKIDRKIVLDRLGAVSEKMVKYAKERKEKYKDLYGDAISRRESRDLGGNVRILGEGDGQGRGEEVV